MVNDHIKGKNMASSHVHNRLNVLTVQSLQGAPKLLQSMRLVDKGIRENHQGTILLKIFHKQSGNYRKQ
jgi:hypothetical protein